MDADNEMSIGQQNSLIRRYSSQPRFNDYREIIAKFDSTGSCNHPIKRGESIGYSRFKGTSFTQCHNCWVKWVNENREADAMENGYMPCCW